MAYDDALEPSPCQFCGTNHSPRLPCPKPQTGGGGTVTNGDIVGGNSVFVFKDEKKAKKRRSTKAVKQPIVRPSKPREQPAAKLQTKKPPNRPAQTQTRPKPAESQSPKDRPTSSRDDSKVTDTKKAPADDACTVNTEPTVRVKTIGESTLVFETKGGKTITIDQPCADSVVKTVPKKP